ncbi:MAG: cytochrome c biogenesis CcdA family protein [Deltaproteobacteria bacterium]|jgi:cytochrome c-type biogenesis protein|nr:cytochrome c biogenesis CcdA family protein [Deltaproteobacteria bacterium]
MFQRVDLLTAFLAGLALFFTPCTLPLIPGWLAAVTGRGPGESGKEGGAPGRSKSRALLSTLFFCLGFALVFTLLGAAASAAGELLYRHRVLLRILGGTVMALFALVLLGILKPEKLIKERRFAPAREPAGYLGALVIGISFAAAWTPCSGPILASILALAAQSGEWRGVRLLSMFSLGLALPFVPAALFVDRALPLFKKAGKWWPLFSKILGVLFLILAVLLVCGRLDLATPDYRP